MNFRGATSGEDIHQSCRKEGGRFPAILSNARKKGKGGTQTLLQAVERKKARTIPIEGGKRKKKPLRVSSEREEK